jgi:Mrp family chromosome partitioning ATPase
MGMARRTGLAEVLVGTSSLDDALYRDPRSAADLLMAGNEVFDPSTLMTSHQMSDLLAQLEQRYEWVIIDTAPVLAVSDGWLLSSQADGTILACLWASTTREMAELGLKELREANARIIGAVLSAVDTKRNQTYGYADTAFQYSGKKYYVD